MLLNEDPEFFSIMQFDIIIFDQNSFDFDFAITFTAIFFHRSFFVRSFHSKSCVSVLKKIRKMSSIPMKLYLFMINHRVCEPIKLNIYFKIMTSNFGEMIFGLEIRLISMLQSISRKNSQDAYFFCIN